MSDRPTQNLNGSELPRYAALDTIEDFTTTDTIDLNSQLTRELTDSGSFDIRSEIWATTFGKLLQALPIPALVINKRLEVAAANQACRRINRQYEGIVYSPVSSLFPDPVSAQEVQSVIKEVFATRKPRINEAMIQIAESRKWVRMTFRSVRVGTERLALVLVEDLTYEKRQMLVQQQHNKELSNEIAERERLEKELRHSQERYRRLVDLSPDGILVHCQGRIVFANRAAAALLRSSPQELVGKNLADLMHPEEGSVGDAGASSACLRENPQGPVEEQWVRSDGEVVPVEVAAADITYEGKAACQVVVRDITERKRNYEILRQSERYKAVSDLASGVAHNFNNFLQIILGNANLAVLNLEAGVFPDLRQNLDHIMEVSRFGAETVRRLSSFVNLRDSTQGKTPEVFDLSDLVRQCVDMTANWWKTNRRKSVAEVELKTDLKPGCIVKGHWNQLFEVLVNLIKNAYEAVSEEGHIEIQLSVEEKHNVLKIHDDGEGIPEDNLGRIFTPFFSTKFEGGTGLGLATSRAIIDSHGGHILLDSVQGKGTTVTVFLPLSQHVSEEEKASEDSAPMVPLNILVIDDLPEVVKLVREALEKAGNTVLTALSGEDGLEIFRQKPTDLVICDLSMPGLNGWQVGRAIKDISLKRGIDSKFIMLTGRGEQVQELDLSESGVDAIVQKPIDIPGILRVVRNVMRSS